MRVLGVLDLLNGRAVHARGGRRDRYEPVLRVGRSTIAAGDAVALARAYTEQFGLSELYVADLDAILGAPPSENPLRSIASLGAPIWLDAGISSIEDARRATERGATRIIVGLETLGSYDVLADICRAAGGAPVAFSLDLRDGIPILARGGLEPGESPSTVAARAVDAGASAVIVLDLARVGAAAGVDVTTIARIREAAPDVTLLAGGGVRSLDDISRLADAGCNGVLLATALLDGQIDAADLAAVRRDATKPASRPIPFS